MGGACDCSKRSVCMGVVASCILTVAFGLNIASVLSCRLVNVESRNDELIYAVGLYSVEGRNRYCTFVNWNDAIANVPYWADRRMNAARITSGIGLFMAFSLFCAMWCSICCGCFRSTFYRVIVALWATLCLILAGCIFLVNSSDYCNNRGCTVARGSGLTIGAMTSYFVVMLIGCLTRDNDDDKCPDEMVTGGETKTTIEKTVNADGTTVTKTTTTNPDGTVTVEERVEAAPVAAPDDVESQDAKVY